MRRGLLPVFARSVDRCVGARPRVLAGSAPAAPAFVRLALDVAAALRVTPRGLATAFDRAEEERDVVAAAVREPPRAVPVPDAAPFRVVAARPLVAARVLPVAEASERVLAAAVERADRGAVLRADVPRAEVVRADALPRVAVPRVAVLRVAVLRVVVPRVAVLRAGAARVVPDLRAEPVDRAGAARVVFAAAAGVRVLARDPVAPLALLAVPRVVFGAARLTALAAEADLPRAGALDAGAERDGDFVVARPVEPADARPVRFVPEPLRVVAERRPPARIAIAFEPVGVPFASSLLM